MPRDMFGDVVDPSIKMGNKMWYTVPLTMLIQAAVVAALIIVPLMAMGCPADAAVDDGVCCGTAAAAAATAAATATRGEGAATADGRQPRRGAARSAEGNQSRDRSRSRLRACVGCRRRHHRRRRWWHHRRHSRTAPATAATGGAGPRRRQHQAAAEDPRRPSRVSADRAVGARPGHRDHRGHDRPRWRGARMRRCSARFRCSIRRRSMRCVSGCLRRPC